MQRLVVSRGGPRARRPGREHARGSVFPQRQGLAPQNIVAGFSQWLPAYPVGQIDEGFALVDGRLEQLSCFRRCAGGNAIPPRVNRGTPGSLQLERRVFRLTGGGHELTKPVLPVGRWRAGSVVFVVGVGHVGPMSGPRGRLPGVTPGDTPPAIHADLLIGTIGDEVVHHGSFRQCRCVTECVHLVGGHFTQNAPHDFARAGFR